jgi:pimeloyl-ACP methyl ester carboxylesterase
MAHDYMLWNLFQAPSSQVSVILIHGFTGDALKSFLSPDGTNLWRQYICEGCSMPDGTTLPGLSTASVWSFRHPAPLLRAKGRQFRIDARAENLAGAIRAGCGADRLIFVVHSYGGLLVKALLMQYPDLWLRTHGIVFLGTPHAGASLADFAWASLRLLPLFRWPLALWELRRDNERLGASLDWFLKQLPGSDKRVVNFYETLRYRGLLIVPEHEARISGARVTNMALELDHVQLAKLDQPDIRIVQLRYVLDEALRRATQRRRLSGTLSWFCYDHAPCVVLVLDGRALAHETKLTVFRIAARCRHYLRAVLPAREPFLLAFDAFTDVVHEALYGASSGNRIRRQLDRALARLHDAYPAAELLSRYDVQNEAPVEIALPRWRTSTDDALAAICGTIADAAGIGLVLTS